MAERLQPYKHFVLILTLLLFPGAPGFGLVLRDFSIWPEGERVWVGMPQGLFIYHPTDQTWTGQSARAGLPANRVEFVAVDQGFAWVLTPKGVANADVRLLDWQVTDSTKGDLPSNEALSLAFQGDYVWVGTSRGASRFDRASQDWRVFTSQNGLPGTRVQDIAVDGNTVWFATEAGVGRFDSDFETFRSYGEKEGLAYKDVRRILSRSGTLWLFSPEGAVRYRKDIGAFRAYPREQGLRGKEIRGIAASGDSLWIVTEAGVSIYDPLADAFLPLKEESRLPRGEVRDVLLDGNDVVFATSQGLFRYSRDTKAWKQETMAVGLASDTLFSLAKSGDLLLATSPHAINLYDSNTSRWTFHPVKEQKEGGLGLALTEGGGLQLALSPTQIWSLKGRSSYFRDEFHLNAEPAYGVEDWKSDLALVGALGRGRTASAYFDNTGAEGTRYGARYLGAKRDWVQQMDLGHFRYLSGGSQLLPNLGLYGGQVRMGVGPKTQETLKSFASFNAQAGERTTAFATDRFTGTIQEQYREISDLSFAKRTYFTVDPIGNTLPIVSGTEKVYKDDQLALTNDPNTLIGTTLAGLTGDWDRLTAVQDYTIDEVRGIVVFNAPLSPSDHIVIQYQGKAGYSETVLFSEFEREHEVWNRYNLGGVDILPNSFRLDIVDTLGREHPTADPRTFLTVYGLDANQDGEVDPGRVDFKRGLLSFPADRPFPQAIYDTLSPRHIYTIRARFRTEVPLFQLTKYPMVKESETITVDGELLERGVDYLVDYTSGLLVFQRRGLVSEESRIEVVYEYVREAKEHYRASGFGFAPSDHFSVEGRFANWEHLATDTTLWAQQNDVQAEYRQSWKGSKTELRIPVEFGTSLVDQMASAQTGAFLLSSPRYKVRTRYEHYERAFAGLYIPQTQVGDLRERTSTFGEYLLSPSSSFSSSFQRTLGRWGGREDNLQGKWQFTKENLPSLGLSGVRDLVATDTLDVSRGSGRLDLDYTLSPKALKKARLKSFKLTSYYREGRERYTPQAVIATEDRSLRHRSGSLGIQTSPVASVYVSGLYEEERTREKLAGIDSDYWLSGRKQWAEYFLLFDRIPSLSLGLVGRDEGGEVYWRSAHGLRDATLDQNYSADLRIYPGIWTKALTPVTFELTSDKTWQGYLTGRTASVPASWLLYASPEGATQASELKRYGARAELRPRESVTYSLRGQWRKTQDRNLESVLEGRGRLVENRLELTPGLATQIILMETYERLEVPGTTLRNTGILWWQSRWGRSLLSKTNLTASEEKTYDQAIFGKKRNGAATLGLTYQKMKWWKGEEMQVSQEVSGQVAKNEAWNGTSTQTTYTSLSYGQARFFTALALRPSFSYSYTPETRTTLIEMQIRATAQF